MTAEQAIDAQPHDAPAPDAAEPPAAAEPTEAAVSPVVPEDVAETAEPNENIAAPIDESPVEDKLTEDKLTEDKPAEDKPTEDKPAEDKSAEEAVGGLRTGMLVEGTIAATSPTQVLIDVGEGRQGMIPTGELERMNRPTLDALRVGEAVTVYVVKAKDHNGNLILSINRAIEEKDWQDAEDYRRSQEVYESRVAGYNKGGLIVRFGRLRGFVPQSQIAAERRIGASEEQLGGMVNEPIMVKVMEVDRGRNRLILSERAATRESREKRKESLISQLTVGETRDGRVVSLEDFGVFVDIGGAEGLVHLTELSWQHVTHPRDLVQVGQTVRVEVISIDKDNKRIGLSMRQLEADPWDRIATTFTIGQLVQGMVTKLTKFGAFAQLVDLPEIEGLIHISELSDKRVAHPREVVNENDKLTLRVVKIDIKSRRLGLSLKRVNSAEYLDLDWSLSMGESLSAADTAMFADVVPSGDDGGTADVLPAPDAVTAPDQPIESDLSASGDDVQPEVQMIEDNAAPTDDDQPFDDQPVDEQFVDDAPSADEEQFVDDAPSADEDQPVDEEQPVDDAPSADEDQPVDEEQPVDDAPSADEEQPVDDAPSADEDQI